MAMATVRVRDEDKAFFASLKAKLESATGQHITLQEVFHRVMALAEEHENDLLPKDSPPKLTPEQIEAFHHGIGSSGGPFREEDVDRILYRDDDTE
jgi:hypothetical protein